MSNFFLVELGPDFWITCLSWAGMI
jgi:hypothetical protein